MLCIGPDVSFNFIIIMVANTSTNGKTAVQWHHTSIYRNQKISEWKRTEYPSSHSPQTGPFLCAVHSRLLSTSAHDVGAAIFLILEAIRRTVASSRLSHSHTLPNNPAGEMLRNSHRSHSATPTSFLSSVLVEQIHSWFSSEKPSGHTPSRPGIVTETSRVFCV
jgi:hypothetical protein